MSKKTRGGKKIGDDKSNDLSKNLDVSSLSRLSRQLGEIWEKKNRGRGTKNEGENKGDVWYDTKKFPKSSRRGKRNSEAKKKGIGHKLRQRRNTRRAEGSFHRQGRRRVWKSYRGGCSPGKRTGWNKHGAPKTSNGKKLKKDKT